MAIVGDSTLVALVTDSWLPGPEHNIQVRLRAVGVENVNVSVSGGRSTVERIADWQENAVEAATAIRQSGFVGCWIVMIGTNDAANVAAGSAVGHAERIDRMMSVVAPDPVLWVDARTQRTTGAYSNVNMQSFNHELDVALYRWPSLRAYYWSDAVLDDWFQHDGIHYTKDGSAWRSAMTAQALVDRFPEFASAG